MILQILLVVCIVASNELKSERLFFYQSNHGDWHANRGDTILSVLNSNNYTMHHGFADAVFEMRDYDIVLLQYSFVSNPDEDVMDLQFMSDSYNNCPLFGKKVVVAVYRVQHRNDVEGCASVDTAFRYLQYIDSHLRLISAGRIRMDLETSVISNICCPCSESECYGPNQYGNFMNKVMEACKPLDTRLDMSVMTRLFLNDGFGGFAGLASLGWIKSFTNYGNYWAINNVNNDPDEAWKWDYNLSVIVHEFGHTMGFGHASATDLSSIGFLKDYTSPDNYGDGGSVMGGGSSWDTIAGPTHYYYRMSIESVEPFWFKMASENSRTRIRLFAWDHPYSRPFLGIEAASHADSDMISGIPFSDNTLAFEFPWTQSTVCSTVSSDVSFGSFFLEYRSKKGNQNGAGNRGVRVIQGRVDKSGFDHTRQVMLSANTDGLSVWADSVIPAGVLWVPDQADVGTIGVRILKIHSVSNSIKESQLDDAVQSLDAIPYMEVEVSYAPGVRYIPPLHPDPMPRFLVSPNLYHCTSDEMNRSFTCELLGVNHFWIYMKPYAHRGHPRVFSLDGKSYLDSAAATVVSLPSRDRSSFQFFYGDYTRHQWTVTVTRANSAGSGHNWMNARLFKRDISGTDDQFELVGSGCVFLASGITGESIELIDLFGYNETVSIPNGGSTILFLQPSHPLPGYYEAFIQGRNGNSIVYSQRLANMVVTLSEPRIAVSLLNSETVALSSVGIPTSHFTFPTFYKPRSLGANEWLNLMLTEWTFDDYMLIDFEGAIPRDLTLTLDTDNGVFSLSLRRLATLSPISLKLSYKQVIDLGSIDGMIHRIQFNKEISLLSVRVVLQSNPGNIQFTQQKGQDYFNVGSDRYNGEYDGFTGFEAQEYECEFKGKKYNLNADRGDEYVIDMKDVSPLYGWQRVLIWIGIGLCIILVIGVIWMCAVCCGKRKRKQLEVPKSSVKTIPQPNPSSPKQKPLKSLSPQPKPQSPKPLSPQLKPLSPKQLPPKPSSPKSLPPMPSQPKPSSPKQLPPKPTSPQNKPSSPKNLPPKNLPPKPQSSKQFTVSPIPSLPSKPPKSSSSKLVEPPSGSWHM